MKRIPLILLAAALLFAKNAPSGKAADASVEIAGTFLDPEATKQAAGSDFDKAYTVIEVTVTPKGKSLELQPDDFLLRIKSNSDSSGPMSASQVYGAGGGLIVHGVRRTIGTTPTDLGYSGVSAAPSKSDVDVEAIKALQSKMLPAKTITGATTGLLFFPIPRKGHRDLDLVYSSPTGKVHVEFR